MLLFHQLYRTFQLFDHGFTAYINGFTTITARQIWEFEKWGQLFTPLPISLSHSSLPLSS